MNHIQIISLLHATLEPADARVLIQLPSGKMGLIRGVTSRNGEIIILTTLDAREEIK
jgi:hypothetical protein